MKIRIEVHALEYRRLLANLDGWPATADLEAKLRHVLRLALEAVCVQIARNGGRKRAFRTLAVDVPRELGAFVTRTQNRRDVSMPGFWRELDFRLHEINGMVERGVPWNDIETWLKVESSRTKEDGPRRPFSPP
jgi:hypothetical protein